MPTENYGFGPVGEIRAASTAGTGTALTTTAAFITIPNGTFWLRLQARNWTTTTVAARVALNPYLSIVKTTDSFATAANVTDGSVNLQDDQASTTFNMVLDTLANGDAIYIGSATPIRGLNIVMDGANVNAVVSTSTIKYWKNTAAWTALTITDNTVTTGETLNKSGTITWTAPTDWLRAALGSSNQSGVAGIAETATLGAVPYSQLPLYWLRWEVSAALTAGTAAQTIVAMNRSTAYWDIPLPLVGDGTTAGQAGAQTQPLDFLIEKGPGGVGCIEALTQASTANLIVDCATRPQNGFTVGL